MRHLPTEEEQGWLIEALGELITKRGSRPFLSRPIIEPDEEHFPDPWSNTFEGADRIARRLMQYADLGHLDIELTTFAAEELNTSEIEEESQRTGAAGLFLGIEHGVCRIALNEGLAADAETIAGVLCHEVAHAYRRIHGLESSHSVREEELLTDLTAFYLGFGILQTNNSSRYRSSGWITGAYAHQEWSSEAFGYLTPQAFAYLMALQLVMRGIEGRARRRILAHLEPNQRSFVATALETVAQGADALRQRLQIPRAEAQEPPIDPAGLQRPLPEYIDSPSAASLRPVGRNHGWPVFRVRQNRADKVSFAALVAAAVIVAVTPPLQQALPWSLALLILLPLAGLGWGRSMCWHICSDPDCRARLGPELEICPGCGGHIVGIIDNANDRLEAEEEYEEERRRAGHTTGEERPLANLPSDTVPARTKRETPLGW